MSKGINKRAMDRQRAREQQNQLRYRQREIKRQENLPVPEFEQIIAELQRKSVRLKDVRVEPLNLSQSYSKPAPKRVEMGSKLKKSATPVPQPAEPAVTVDAEREASVLVAERTALGPPPRLVRARSTAKAASAVFDFLSPVFPKRIANEDLGDAIEDLNRMPAEGRPAWQIAVRALVWFFILVMSLVRFFKAAMNGSDVKRLG